jgi:hypothetical protein
VGVTNSGGGVHTSGGVGCGADSVASLWTASQISPSGAFSITLVRRGTIAWRSCWFNSRLENSVASAPASVLRPSGDRSNRDAGRPWKLKIRSDSRSLLPANYQ